MWFAGYALPPFFMFDYFFFSLSLRLCSSSFFLLLFCCCSFSHVLLFVLILLHNVGDVTKNDTQRWLMGRETT